MPPARGRRAAPRLARWLPLLATILILAWGYLWIVREARGLPVHAALGVAFALLAIWGVLRARPD